jgi:H+/Cl- antiporter ClcA
VAEFVTIDGQQYMKRQPLGVLGLTLITFGIYFFYWYYKIVDEIRRFEKDDSVRPGMALLAVTLGALILVPPFISLYNTSVHIVRMEHRLGNLQPLSPLLNLILLLIVGIVVPVYTQEHLNRVWDRAAQLRVQRPVPRQLPPPP